jgi:hypothetical protein
MAKMKNGVTFCLRKKGFHQLGVGVGIAIGVESPAEGNLGFRAASAFFRYRSRYRPRLEIILTSEKMGKLLIFLFLKHL